MDENSVNVKCSFCGKEIECPKDMLETAKRHMCHECFFGRAEKGLAEDLKGVHIDIPPETLIAQTASNMVNQMVDEVFPMLWGKRKGEFKEMSTKDIAHEMFGAGAYIALSNFMKMQYERDMKDMKKEK